MSDEDVPYKPRERRDVLAFMASLATTGGFRSEAEGFILELLTLCAFPAAGSNVEPAVRS